MPGQDEGFYTYSLHTDREENKEMGQDLEREAKGREWGFVTVRERVSP